ncbi:MAG: hypothetical protein ACFE9Q_01280 [Candidatus Hodarchaeota archaeon]
MKENLATKSVMSSYFFEDPKYNTVIREINKIKVSYYYFDLKIILKTGKSQVLNGSLLLGDANLIIENKEIQLNQFDIFFIPPEKEIIIRGKSKSKYKIALVFSPTEARRDLSFEVKKYNIENFIPRGESSSNEKLSTYRTVWTAFNNGFFMSGITNIPNESLKTGVVTSVNLEKNREKGKVEIYPHIHPEFPELYIYLIDDNDYAVTQYLINSKGQSVCKDLSNGDGLFFPGDLGHVNFAKPFYRNLKFCSYIWFIPTFGKKGGITPITLKI